MQNEIGQVCVESEIDVGMLASIGEDVRIRKSAEGRYSVAWHFAGTSRVVSSETLTDAAFLALACAEALQNRAACEAL